MKIAIIRQRYNPYGGAERFVSRALNALSRQQQVSLHLIARKWEPIDGIEFHSCNPFYLGRLARDWGFAAAACRLAAGLNVDLVQSHERLACCDIYRAGDGVHREWLKQRSRQLNPLARWGLQLNPYHLYIKWAERKLFQSERLRAVICNSQMVKNEISNYFDIAEQKIHVIRNGIDSAAFHPALKQQRAELRRQWHIAEDALVYLFVGSGYARKGLQQTLQALARVPHGQLVVVGHDKHERRYRKLAEKLQIGERVLFLGGQREVKPFYAMSDVFVLPTLYDPFPNAVLEAMACGLPVVTSSKCGAAEMVSDGVSGFVCDALDVDHIAASMAAIDSRQRADSMGQEARKQAEQLDWDIIGNSLTTLYQSLSG